MTIKSLGHLNIIVDDIDSASKYYSSLLKAEPQQRFPNFRNEGFSKSAGFMESPNDVDVSIEFLKIDESDVFIELMQYHCPQGINNQNQSKQTNTIGNIGHVCLKVSNIEDEFNRIKNHHDVRLISDHNEYKPFKISNINQDEFFFFDEDENQNLQMKKEVCHIISNIKYFYFVDKYGIQWEFEEGHTDIGG
ncbi:bleomycin resistance protein [Photobacterium kishitanii]|uniref:VOC family protein n=1 Tax=Photobacterium kishitanii TaxID=318456 RepID=UPI0005D360C9|nr:VOC family protein [Photobacterium kishitanii]KJG11780.1 glyoxalase/Bleomycin resistance protein/dioxygenase superfamily [Photobacterium kishitanii]PSV05958.1 bleomycin resistance protein [Photobacterium kishitanii]PSV77749.1 bleomycin resistance protein [Photobacterium kishitanii]